MDIQSGYSFSQHLQTVFNIEHSKKKVQVAQVRGILKDFRMAVFYEFSTNMTMELLNKIIEKVEMAGAKEETLLAKPHLQTALENDSSPTEFRKAYKIKKEHLECKGNERQRVYL